MATKPQKLNFHFCAEFFSSTRHLPAAARRRTEVHRVRAVRQQQFCFFNFDSCILKLTNQFELIMQNKPNLLNTRINVTSALTKDYGNEYGLPLQKNKPNSKPNKANFNPKNPKFPIFKNLKTVLIQNNFCKIHQDHMENF